MAQSLAQHAVEVKAVLIHRSDLHLVPTVLLRKLNHFLTRSVVIFLIEISQDA